MISLKINEIPVEVDADTTILQAAAGAGIKIPTLCHLANLQSIGACRVCLVEVKGAKALVPACVTKAGPGLEVHTNTKRVRDARRMVVELLLSEHQGDCQTCERNNDCELQALAHELGINTVRYAGAKAAPGLDESTPALVRDNGKCIKCRRCVAACSQVQGINALFPQYRGFDTVIGPAFAQPLAGVVCVQCGQCAAVCPVGAIREVSHLERVWQALDDPAKCVVVQTAPAVRASLGECFDLPAGTLVTGKMVTALRRLGFDHVFDTNFTADLTIIEESAELLHRLKTVFLKKEQAALPQFTSCSPGWIKFVEHYNPEFLPCLSSCKSPQQMFGAVAKTYLAGKLGKQAQDMYVVSIMPCTAKKYEAQRPEMNASGVQDVDAVLTTRELGRLIKEAGIDFINLSDGEMDKPLGLSTGAADIFGATGGVMEAALRTAYEVITGRTLPFTHMHVDAITGLEGLKTASILIQDTLEEWSFLEGVTLNVAVVHGLGNTRKTLEQLKAGKVAFHFIEVMACPGGCIGGGGQPRMTTDAVREKRIEALYKEDDAKKLRKSHDNPKIKQIYGDFLVHPLSKNSHELLHTTYTKRDCV